MTVRWFVLPDMTDKFIVFITGASGVGKTTLLENLRAKYGVSEKWEFLKFDSVGVPSGEEMIRDFGSGENWQRQTTFEWIDKMVNRYPDKELIIMDGQVNLDFIISGFENRKFRNYQIVLIDCSQETMVRRLIDERQQAWLAGEDMKNWLKFLRDQADRCGTQIIDTTSIDKQETVARFEVILEKAGYRSIWGEVT